MLILYRLLWIVLSVGLFSLLHDWFGLNIYFLYIIPGLLILVFGLPHGATDHMLSNFIRTRKVTGRVNIQFITSYLLIILIYAVLWIISSETALLIFLLLSAYHFGETQWIRAKVRKEEKLWIRIHNFSWGVLLLGALFAIHPDDTQSFLAGLIADRVASSALNFTTYWLIPFSLSGTIILSIFLYDRRDNFNQVLELLVLLILFRYTELIYAFAIFFTLYHSRDTIVALLRIINHQSSSRLSWIHFYRYAFPFTAISLLGIVLIILVINFLEPDIHLITLFFVMISLITAPHMWIIEKFYGSTK